MMGSGRPKSGDGRAITADEAEMWKHATRALAPVKAKPRVARTAEASAAGVRAVEKPLTTQSPSAAATASPPPLAAFERRLARGIAAGRIPIGARLDLHGCQEHSARARLRAFLLAAQDQAHTTVLVITGKGALRYPESRSGDGLDERPRGVLRRSVPRWLAEPDLRALVSSFAEAGVRHGGAGALYVRLRKVVPQT